MNEESKRIMEQVAALPEPPDPLEGLTDEELVAHYTERGDFASIAPHREVAPLAQLYRLLEHEARVRRWREEQTTRLHLRRKRALAKMRDGSSLRIGAANNLYGSSLFSQAYGDVEAWYAGPVGSRG